ncbi:DUF805 domain-containing protein [Caulobacter sp. 1776]|uniref:DUF805 domain-containing protein n=1 Tax=Caulobacter sp. 1776 TaxID=3156420 RepID=UPI003398BB39
MARKLNLALEDFFSFDGRFRRLEFWIANLGLLLLQIATQLVVGPFFGESLFRAGRPSWFRLALNVASLWPTAAILIKRGHDRNRSALFTSGLLLVIYIFPEVGLVMVRFGVNLMNDWLKIPMGLVAMYMLIDYGFIDGTQGPNRYGPSPKGIGAPTLDVAATFD